MWAEWADPNSSADEFSRAFESMELFVLLAMIDPVAWRVALKELKDAEGFYSEAFKMVELHVPLRIVGYELRFTVEADASVFSKRLLEYDGERLSDDYTRALAELEGSVEEDRNQLPQRIPVRLRLAPRWSFGFDIREVMADITSLARRQNSKENHQAALPSCRLALFRSHITEFHSDATALREGDDAFLKETFELQSYGVKVAVIPSITVAIHDVPEEDDAWFVKTVNSVLGSTGHVHNLGADHAMVGPRQPVARGLGALSAVAHSETVNYVSADFSFAWPVSDLDKRRYVHWIAYALFSPHARVKPTRVFVTAITLTEQHVAWIEELLRAEDQLAALFPEDNESIAVYKHRRIATSKIYLTDPLDPGRTSPQSMVSDASFDELRALGKVDDWWVVALPGSGPAWVLDEHATVSTIELSPTLSFTRPLHQFDITVGPLFEGARAATAALLRLVGPAAKKVSVGDSGIPHELWGQRVIDCCPQIEQLMYDTAAPNQLGLFLEAFENFRISGICICLLP